MDSPVVELCVEEPGHELWASVGVRLPLDEKEEGDSLQEGAQMTDMWAGKSGHSAQSWLL